MIELWYINIVEMSLNDLRWLLSELPQDQANLIARRKLESDQKFKLAGRYMVKKFHLEKNRWTGWEQWQVKTGGKPFVENGYKFNITHSGNYVIVAFSQQEVGVDLEEIASVDANALADYFHSDEQQFIQHSTNKKLAFFQVWTRKEAYLKAIGIGVMNGLNNENCLKRRIGQQAEWGITEQPLFNGYQLAICSPYSQPEITVVTPKVEQFEIEMEHE